MAKTEKRKNWKDHQDDYRNANLKVALIEVRLSKRATELCRAYPDVVLKSLQMTAIEFVDGINKGMTADPEQYISIIRDIEEHLAAQHPHQQGSFTFETEVSVEPEYKDYIEYQDVEDDYKNPERKFENENIPIRLYCMHENCITYIKGTEGYNGGFQAETGQFCDLRNQGYLCTKHRQHV